VLPVRLIQFDGLNRKRRRVVVGYRQPPLRRLRLPEMEVKDGMPAPCELTTELHLKWMTGIVGDAEPGDGSVRGCWHGRACGSKLEHHHGMFFPRSRSTWLSIHR
jgi:hypothetical protein